MAHGMKDIILVGLEETPGTEAASMALHQPFIEDGLIPDIQGNNAEVRPSTTFPYQLADIPIGATANFRLMPHVNVNTIRDLITIPTLRTSGDLPSLTFKHTRAGIGHAQYLGSVCSQCDMRYSRQSQPENSSVLAMELSFECMKPENTTGVSAGTPATGAHFRIEEASFTLNAVQALEVLSYERSMQITHDLGALDNAGKRLYITHGDLQELITLTARFSAAAWSNLILNKTEFAAAFVHGTGGANETVTETMGKCQVRSHNLSKSSGTVIEQITLRPGHTGAAAPTVWTYGSAIGATALFA